MTRVLILGGTLEAHHLARVLAAAGIDAVYSYAGRTAHPRPQPLPTRIGGFGGPDGLARWLGQEGISHVVDATHPFAARISRSAVEACLRQAIPLIGFERPCWQPAAGDRWCAVEDVGAALAALPAAPSRVFLAIGRQNLAVFAAKPQHHYLVRLVDPPTEPLPLPRRTVIVARGPFDEAGDRALLETNRIDLIVAKNGGAPGARAKLDAARALGLPVIMIARPAQPPRQVAADAEAVLAWLAHGDDRGV